MTSTTRLFIGNVVEKTSEQDLNEIFGKYGPIYKLEVKTGYAFVYYEDAASAEDAIRGLNGHEIDGSNIVVKHAKTSKDYKNKPLKRLDLRISVLGLDSRISWQDLKDWGRVAGEVTFANTTVTRDNETIGVIEYVTLEGMETALRTLEDIPIKGLKIRTVKEDVSANNRYEDREFRDNAADRNGGKYDRNPVGSDYHEGAYESRRAPRYDEPSRDRRDRYPETGRPLNYDRPSHDRPPYERDYGLPSYSNGCSGPTGGGYDAPPVHRSMEGGRGYSDHPPYPPSVSSSSRRYNHSDDYRRPPAAATATHAPLPPSSGYYNSNKPGDHGAADRGVVRGPHNRDYHPPPSSQYWSRGGGGGGNGYVEEDRHRGEDRLPPRHHSSGYFDGQRR